MFSHEVSTLEGFLSVFNYEGSVCIMLGSSFCKRPLFNDL